MINVCYSGTWRDPTGYGQANRADIFSLFVAGVNITTELVTQTTFASNYGILENVSNYLQNRQIPYKVKIIHLTPDHYETYRENGKYNIGRLFWETDKLPAGWADACNSMNEIWTASKEQANMIRASGVTVPIYDFSQSLMVQSAEEDIRPFETQYKKDFTFYSIFQWIDRKNPKGLLRAYWKAFEGNDDVTLLLKTYRGDYSEQEFQRIKSDISSWKVEARQKHFPKIHLIKRLVSYDEMARVHAMGDCFINPSSGEGWCRPMQEAMLYGKPVISPKNGGITDIIPDECYFDIPSQLKKVTQQVWIPYYTADQNWKEIDEDSLSKAMFFVYENYLDSLVVGRRAKKYVIDNFNPLTVGQQMKSRLEEIYRSL